VSITLHLQRQKKEDRLKTKADKKTNGGCSFSYQLYVALIERAQFALNDCTYQPGVYKYDNGSQGSFLEYFLHEMEKVHGKHSCLLFALACSPCTLRRAMKLLLSRALDPPY
jgi:hypothetical protein